MIITLAHARQALGRGSPNACNRGIRVWCNSHGINLQNFIENGMELSTAELIDDPLAKKIIEVAKNGQK